MAQRRSVTFLAGVTGVASAFSTDWFPLDYRFDPDQNRTFTIVANSADSINIEVTNVDVLKEGTSGITAVTADTFTGSTSYVATLNGPFAAVRITKNGANGAATVIGVV